MKWNWNLIKQKILGQRAPGSMPDLDPDMLKEMARGIATTHSDEIGCARCFDEMDESGVLLLMIWYRPFPLNLRGS